MRFYSKHYKKKINSLIHIAKVNDLPFKMVINALKGISSTKQDKRYKNERIVWCEASISDSCVAFLLETLRNKRLSSLAACFTVEQFHALEKHYGQCPENIVKKVINALTE